jgi:hypothetical protein
MIAEKKPPTSSRKSPNTFADVDGFCQNEISTNSTNTVVRLFRTVMNVTDPTSGSRPAAVPRVGGRRTRRGISAWVSG